MTIIVRSQGGGVRTKHLWIPVAVVQDGGVGCRQRDALTSCSS